MLSPSGQKYERGDEVEDACLEDVTYVDSEAKRPVAVVAKLLCGLSNVLQMLDLKNPQGNTQGLKGDFCYVQVSQIRLFKEKTW